MKVLNCSKIKEEAYTEKLDNGLRVIIVPKKEVNKKYVIWGTNFGSIDNHFIDPSTNKEVVVPDGVAHFLEHKMFEQPDGTNSLDTLMALGLEANAYTTNDHTAYLFECSDDKNFYKGFDELMDYVQSPYYTDQNVEKEKGIIGQEIMMYDDDPGFKVYLNALQCLYHKNSVRLDIAGTIESISKITPEILYNCYNTFYNPSNMVLVIVGNFEPEAILNEVKTRLKPSKNYGEIKRFYAEEPESIYKDYMETKMHVSMPLFMIGFKDKIVPADEVIRRHMAIEIILGMVIGKSSKLYQELYNKQVLLGEPDLEYEFSKEYAHVLIGGQTTNPQLVKEMLITELKNLKENGFNKEDFERNKRKMYGEYVSGFNDVGSIARMFLSDSIRNVNSFQYVEEYKNLTEEYLSKILNEVFDVEKMVLSVINK